MMRGAAALALIAALVAGCATAASSSPAPTATTTAIPTTTAAPTARPSPVPSPTADPSAGLSVSALTYSTNTCYVDVKDADGHVLHGGVVSFAVTVTNAAAHKSVPIWLRVRPDDQLPSNPMALEGSTGKTVKLAGQSSGFGGTTIPGKGKSTLKWRVFFESAYSVHYQPTLRYGDPDATAGVVWDHSFTTINVC